MMISSILFMLTNKIWQYLMEIRWESKGEWCGGWDGFDGKPVL